MGRFLPGAHPRGAIYADLRREWEKNPLDTGSFSDTGEFGLSQIAVECGVRRGVHSVACKAPEKTTMSEDRGFERGFRDVR
jgi:hypothetical protein